MRVLLAGGGTAGHVEPALNTADELVRRNPDVQIVAIGTESGLEAQLVPARGYQLEIVPAFALPRRPSLDLLRTPARLRRSIRATRSVMADYSIDVVVGFGGYVATPAYFAARHRVPIVIHEANAKPGIANRVGARWATAVAQAQPNSLTGAVTVGIPLRRTIAELDRLASRQGAREHFGLTTEAPTLLVFGGSLGARRINDAIAGALPELSAAGIDVIHIAGKKNDDQNAGTVSGPGRYVRMPYCDRMELAYAAADLALCRAGAMTCAELATVGLPAIYVPLPIGNGEQRLNAAPTVDAGGGVFLPDAELSARNVADISRELLADPGGLATMSASATSRSSENASALLADLVESAAGQKRGKRE